RLKYVGKTKYGLGQPPKQKIDGLPIIRATNVFRGKIDEKDLVFVDPDDIPYERDPILRTDDIIVVRSGAYTADSAIIPSKYDGAVTGYDMVFRCNENFFPKFVAFGLLSDYILKRQLIMHSLRAAQPHLNREELGETIIAVPSFEEQKTIVQKIETECSAIEAKKAKTQKLINLLTEYRTALISEVVTGKIKVTD
ncbi:restriction endonuclease subunit S, partial [Algoriphagus sp. NF]|uniref:restriction endonuclease subunit S n=1 Tax=Algoriphagus sp. NF TaxID=2992756 RepID=UPI00237B7800